MIVQDILKAHFLVGLKSLKHWILIIYTVIWTMILIANTQIFEEKVMKVKVLTEEVKELRSEYVDRRSELMQKRMESNVAQQMEPLGILPSIVPPKKIKVVIVKEKKWYDIWPKEKK